MINPKFRNALTSGSAPVIGGWMTIGNADIAEIMVQSGLDAVVIDLEHSHIDMTTMGQLVRIVDLGGAAPLVRLSSNDPVQAKRVMDAGAHGIIVPMVNTPGEARAAYQSIHYPPEGTRGVGLGRAHAYGPKFQEYRRLLKESAVLIVQIEHKTAVANLEAILALPEVDAFILGPYDLSASLGVPGEFGHPSYRDAIAQVERVAKAAGKPAGAHLVEPDLAQLRDLIAREYRFIAYSVDMRILDSQLRLAVAAARGGRP